MNQTLDIIFEIDQKFYWKKVLPIKLTDIPYFIVTIINGKYRVNPFISNTPFFYPLKTSESLAVFWCFQGVEKGCIGNEWVN